MSSGILRSFLFSLGVLVSVTVAQTPASQGALLIEPGNNAGKCMTASSNTDGAAVTIQSCTGAAAQKWTFSGGSVHVFDNKCLDVTNGANVEGVKLQIWTCTGGTPQQFYYTGDYKLAWTNHGKCLDLPGGNMADGNQLQMLTCGSSPNQVWNTGYLANALPEKSQKGQTGINNCGRTSSQFSECQTLWINDVDDFCLWAPPNPLSAIGDVEENVVAWCTRSGRGTRTIPNHTLKGVHFVKTPDYVQVTGVGDLTKLNILSGDQGGELDPHGADGNGNPVGGLVFGNTFGDALQYHEWTSFISSTQFCFRACTGPNAAQNCQHIYDLMGCHWNMPANYDANVFESCDGDNDLPMGVYGTSTWYQGVSPTPPPHPVASSSDCRTLPTVTVAPAPKVKRDGFVKRFAAAEPTPM